MAHNAVVNMYNMLTDESASYLNLSPSEPKASMRIEGCYSQVPLTKTGTTTDNTYLLELDDEEVRAKARLRIEQSFTLENLMGLFALEENSLAPIAQPGDVLGLAATWWSDKAQLRGCEEIDEITATMDGVASFLFRQEFAPGMLAGKLEICFILFMKKPGASAVPGFAHTQGTVLGELARLTIMLDGEGAAFPIAVTNQPGEPLWWNEIHIDDPFTERFTEESFCVVLNEGHPDFAELGRENGYNSVLYREAFASAIEELLVYLRMEYHDDLVAADFENVATGTIAYAAHYMIDTMEIDMSDIMSIHQSVRRAVARQLKEGC